MVSNIYHLAEQEISGPDQIYVGDLCFTDRFQQMLSAQAQIAFADNAHLTAWMSLSDGEGTDQIINLINPQPRRIPLQGMTTLSRLLSRGDASPDQISPEKLTKLRQSGVDIMHQVPADLGAITLIRIAPEMSPIQAHLWLVCHARSGCTKAEKQRAAQLASLLAGSLDREVDLMLRERAQKADQRMADLAGQIADLFAAPGMPISNRFRAMLDTCCSAFDMEKGYVTLLKGSVPAIQFRNSRMPASNTKDQASPNARRLTDQLLHDTTTLALDNVERSRHAGLVDFSGAPAGRFLGCPIRFDGRTHGTIELIGATAASQPYTQSECAMLRTLSIYAAGPLVLLGEALRY